MTITLQNGTTGILDQLGALFKIQEVINTARGTTVPAEFDDFFALFNNLTIDDELEFAVSPVANAALTAKRMGAGEFSTIQQVAINLLIEIVNDDVPLSAKTLGPALAELLDQIETAGATVDASAVTVAVAADASNTGNGVILATAKRGDGTFAENAFAEVFAITGQSNPDNATLRYVGEAAANEADVDWPQGSGASGSLVNVAASSSLLANGDFEDEDDVTDAPDDWIVSVGTIGTTLKMSNVEQQTVAISGTPTAGFYTLSWANGDGDVQTSIPLVFNAAATAVQAALRKLVGLESVTVTATGTSPNLTHTVVFTGAGGNVAELTSTSNLDTGSIGHATTVAGTALVFQGSKSVEFDSNGSQLTTINQRVAGLTPETAYGFSMWLAADVVPAAGEITVDLVDGIGGAVIPDAQGFLNSFTLDANDLTTSFQHVSTLVATLGPRNEVQTLTITGTPTGGTFTLTVDAGDGVPLTTGAIAYNADAATVQAAIVALANVAAGDVSCGGGALPGTPVTITFTELLAGRAMPLVTADGALLTGGTTPDATVALTTLGTGDECVFRTPAVIPDVVYLRIRISTAVSSGTSVFLDHAALTEMPSLYQGGPLAKAFVGSIPFKTADKFTLTVTNDRAGALQSYFEQNFQMRARGLQLPSNSFGDETIPDSVIA